YQAGAVEAARTLLEGLAHSYDLRDAAEEESRSLPSGRDQAYSSSRPEPVSSHSSIVFSQVFHYLGVTLHRLGREPDAKEQYLRVLQMCPSKERTYFNIGHLYAEQGLTENAIEMYRASISSNPDYVKPYVSLAILFENRDVEASIVLLSEAKERGIADEYVLA